MTAHQSWLARPHRRRSTRRRQPLPSPSRSPRPRRSSRRTSRTSRCPGQGSCHRAARGRPLGSYRPSPSTARSKCVRNARHLIERAGRTGAARNTLSSLLARLACSCSSAMRRSALRIRSRCGADRRRSVPASAGTKPTWTRSAPETVERDRDERSVCQTGCCGLE